MYLCHWLLGRRGSEGSTLVVELVEEELLLTVVWLVAWLVLAVTAFTLGMVVDRMGVQVEMMVERIIKLGIASLVSVGINDL